MNCFFRIIVSFLLVSLNSCQEREKPAALSEANILSYNIQGKELPVIIDTTFHTVTLRFPDSAIHASRLIAGFVLSPNCRARINHIAQVSGISQNTYGAPLVYTISNSSGRVTDWTVCPVNNDSTPAQGLGGFLTRSRASDRNYPWYIDQKNTGEDSADNCGPSCAVMACLWANAHGANTVSNARQAYKPEGGWWSTDDITNYLFDNKIPHQMVSLPSSEEETTAFLLHQIDGKRIVILNVNMSYIRDCWQAGCHTDRLYSVRSNNGHFFIVKGYKEVDGKIYYETYDPYSWGNTYADSSPTGKDRYYRCEDVFAAARAKWLNAIVIAKKSMHHAEDRFTVAYHQ